MTENEKCSAMLKGVLATIIELVDTLTAGSPGLSVALEERLKAQLRKLEEADDEESFYASLVPQMVLKKITSPRR